MNELVKNMLVCGKFCFVEELEKSKRTKINNKKNRNQIFHTMDRLHILQQHLNPELKEEREEDQETVSMNSTSATSNNTSKASFTVTDNRTGKSIDVPVVFDGKAIRATDFSKLGVNVFDPGYMNTAVVRSRITYIDGDNGILRYRGYNIEELCANCNFLEVAYLLVNGELPTKNQFEYWNDRIMKHTYLHQNLLDLLKTFRYDAQFCTFDFFSTIW